jgi:simple sugar transport system permease protein
MKLNVDLTPRTEVPRWMRYGAPVFTVLAALLVSSVALIALAINPVDAYYIMFVQTMTTEFGLTNTIAKAVPLIFTGLAVYIPLKAQLWNIGAEGQLFLGAIAGTWIGLSVSLPMYALLPLMFIGGGLAGAAWTAIPALLRAKLGINEIITTLLFVFVAAQVKNYLVRGPLQSPTANFPQSSQLPAAAQLPDIPVLGYPAGIVFAVILVAVTYLVINYTPLGYEITFIGASDRAAKNAGMSKFKIYTFVLLSGGAMAGFAGVSELAGVQGRLRASFAPGYGFTAIPIALLGRNGAVQVMLAALFFAVIFVGGSNIQTLLGIPSAIVDIIQALIILFLITSEFFKQYSVNITLQQAANPGASAQPEGKV